MNGFRTKDHPNYNIFNGMKNRCYNENLPSYPNYGGRGIKICDRWLNSFENFCEDMGVRPSPEHSIGRIDNSGDYEPLNCRWENDFQQMGNRRVFESNTSGYEGVEFKKKTKRWIARYQENNVRYKVSGTFETAEEAFEARNTLITKIRLGEDVSDMIERQARYDNKTGVRGISCRIDVNGKEVYVVRMTNKNKVREYLGYFDDFEEAKRVRQEWIESQS